MKNHAVHTVISLAAFTRPTDTTGYTAGDAMGSTSTCVLQFPVTHPHGVIKSARLWKSTTGTTGDDFRLLLFRANPALAATAADNLARATPWMTFADAANFVGSIDFETGTVLADGAVYEGQDYVPTTGVPMHVSGDKLYGILVAIGTYAPGNAEQFRIQLEISQ